MSKNVLRSVNTKFWVDSYIEDLNPSEKLLFLYFLTNPQTNMLGVYEISLKRISYDTGINKETILKALKGFERVKKVYFIENYVILPNFLKNQNLNLNMQKSCVDIYNNLPNTIKIKLIGEDIRSLSKDSKGFERLRNPLVNIEVEREVEKEIEIEIESDLKITKIDFIEFWNLYDKKTGDKSKLIKKWNSFSLELQNEILEYIPLYKLSQPQKQFRKNAETFFNQKGWEDELISTESNTQTVTKQVKNNEPSCDYSNPDDLKW